MIKTWTRDSFWAVAAILYLAFPSFLFFGSWLRAPYNILTVIGLVVAVSMIAKQLRSVSSVQTIPLRYIALTLGIAIALAALSGAGGFVWQKPDWTKHNVMLNDLMRFDWPVYYGKGSFVVDTTLVYYIAYYLPAALVGKVWGWYAAHWALFIYTTMGIWIFAQLVFAFLQKKQVALFTTFFMMSGLDLFGCALFGTWIYGLLHLEVYTAGLQFSSPMTILTWVTQHAIPAWIMAGYFTSRYRHVVVKNAALYAAIIFLWSPFISVGILFSVPWWRYLRQWRSFLSLSNIIGIGMLGLLFVYFKSQLPLGTASIAWYFTASDLPLWKTIAKWVLFLLFDLYFMAPLFFFVRKHIPISEKIEITWLFLSLTLITQIMYGINNDFGMRVSILPLAMLFLYFLRYLPLLFERKHIMALILVLYLLGVGAVSNYFEILQLASPAHIGLNEQPRYDLLDSHKRYGVAHQQYMGSASRAFGKYFGNYQTAE